MQGPRELRVTTTWACEKGSDGSEGVFYVVRRGQSSEDLEEAFVVAPINPSVCFVYFISSFDPLAACRVPLVSHLYSDTLKVQRVSGTLSILKEHAEAHQIAQEVRMADDVPFEVASESDDSTLSNNEAAEALKIKVA